MKKIITSLFLFISFLLVAQSTKAPAKLQWGPELKEPSTSYISKIITSHSEGFYALRNRQLGTLTPNPKIWVEYYTNDMKLQRSAEIDLKFNKKTRDFEDVISLGGHLYLLTSFNNQTKRKNYLFSQKLNSRLVPEKNVNLIGEIDTRSLVKEGRFDTFISKDSTKLLLYNQLPYQRNTPERFAFRVFDEDMNELWKKNITLPYNDDIFEVKEYQVDDKGNVYLLGLIYEENNRRLENRGRPTYKYILLAYTNDGQDKEEYKIDLGDKFITDLTYRVAKDGELVFAGFYSEKNATSAKGTFYFQIDALSKEMINRSTKEFEFEFLTEEMSDFARKRAERAEERGDTEREAELFRYDLDDLILRSDGGAVLIAEQYYVYQETNPYGFNGQVQRNYYYNYNDIIVVNISPDGEIEWTSRINKRQRTVNDGGYFSSYAMAITRGKLFFVYNDNIRNLEAADGQRRSLFDFTGNQSVIALAEIDMQGRVKTYPLENIRDASVYTRPKICKQIGKRNMAIYGEDGRVYRFGNLYFK